MHGQSHPWGEFVVFNYVCLFFSLQFVNPEMPGYVGFANLPNQVHRKSVKKGFEFTLMVVGMLFVYQFIYLPQLAQNNTFDYYLIEAVQV